MSTSTDAILAYGISLGGEDEDWQVDGVDIDDESGEEISEYVERILLAANGFAEREPEEDLSPNWLMDTYLPWRQRRNAALAAIGVCIVHHCSADYSMYLLATYSVEAARGYPVDLDMESLTMQRIREGWDNRMSDALKALGWSTDQQPRWILCSHWG